jgi:hypothetical protein
MPTPRTRKGGTSVEGDDGPREQTAVDSILDDAPEGDPQPAAQDVHPTLEHEPPQPPSADHDAPHQPPPPARQKGGAGTLIAVLLGGAIAAGAGFGLSRFVPDGWPIQSTAALESQIAAQAERIDALSASLAEITDADPVAPLRDAVSTLAAEAGALRAGLTAVEGRLATLPAAPSADLGALEDRLAALEALAPAGALPDGAALADLSGAIAALRAELDAQKAAVADMSGRVDAAAAAAQAELEATRADAERPRAEAEEAARLAALRAALGRVQAAADSGASFAEPLAELSTAGVDVPADLVTNAEGLPTLAALQEGFAEPARAALRASLDHGAGETLTERVTVFLRNQTGARSLTPREGADPDAILSRAEAALRDGDLAGALAELAALPETGQAQMAPWIAQVQIRIDGLAAVAALATALGEG